MKKRHLIIKGGAVRTFVDRTTARDWARHVTPRWLAETSRDERAMGNPRARSFREWVERNRALHSEHCDKVLRHVAAASSGPIESRTATSRMLEAWRTRGPLFGRQGGEDGPS